jgi:hypothetical protein
MNKQIEEIALQSKLGGADFGNGVKYYVGTEETFNNFAESIVKECANELIKWKSEPFPYDPEFGARLIKQHFGIEQ